VSDPYDRMTMTSGTGGTADTPDPRPRVTCVCGISVLPENWSNHLLRQDGKRHYLPRPVSPPSERTIRTDGCAGAYDAGWNAALAAARAAPQADAGREREAYDAGRLAGFEEGLAASPAAPVGLDVHPHTCGTCRWEGSTRAAYIGHIMAFRHDHWDSPSAEAEYAASQPSEDGPA